MKNKVSLKWNIYPVGADVKVFDDSLHLIIFKWGKKLTMFRCLVYGVDGPAPKIILGISKTKESAMLKGEKWLKLQAEELLSRF